MIGIAMRRWMCGLAFGLATMLQTQARAADCVAATQPVVAGTVLMPPSQGAVPCVVDFNSVAAKLREVLTAGGIVLLGEVHDNAAHHEWRGKLLPQLIGEKDGNRPRPGLVFEHIRVDQADGIAAFKDFDKNAARLGTVNDLFRFLDWKSSGWPDQDLFAPLFSAVVQSRLPIIAGHPPRTAARDVARNGLAAALDKAEIERLKLDTQLPANLQDALLGELEGSHCGMMPKSAFGNMALAQNYRDAHLADALLKASEANGSAILFAGNGHVRADRGVPYYLKQRADKPVATVMLVELESGNVDVSNYVTRGPDGAWAADYVVVTVRATRKDPCEEMRAMMTKKK
jgi:uncharacterized iron-regulated protein